MLRAAYLSVFLSSFATAFGCVLSRRDLVSLAEVFLHLAAQTVDSLSSNGWLGFSGNSVRTFLGTEKLQLLRVLPVLCVFGSLPVRHWAAKGPQNSSLPFWKDVLLAVASLFKVS